MRVTERGWAGHFVCADRCLFTRNTLIEDGDIKVVVSTVGRMRDFHAKGFPNRIVFVEIGGSRFYETMVFHADVRDTRFYDADVSRGISLNGEWSISEIDAEDRANIMHDNAVEEIKARIKSGEITNA